MLYLEIFQLDWLVIDVIIIILLISILLIVKFFKIISRWRFRSSNTSLSKIKIEGPYINAKESAYTIKKANIIRNVRLKDSERSKLGIITFTLNFQTKLSINLNKSQSNRLFRTG